MRDSVAIGLVLLGLGWLLLACGAKGGVPPAPSRTTVIQVTATSAPWTPTVSPVPISPATPTLPATATSEWTPTVTLTVSATPSAGTGGMPADGMCVAVNDTITITAQVFRRPDFEEEIEAYLNAGGSVSSLAEALISTSPERAIRIQVVVEDVTGSGIEDVSIGVTLPYTGGDGEAHLLFYTCVEGRYEGDVVFRRAGAGSRSEGLYKGGGVVVESVGDLNGNGRAEVFFAVNWPGYAEYYLGEWNGKQLASLIEYENRPGSTCYWIEVLGQEVAIVDVEGDGLYEIVVGEQGDRAGEEMVIWRWDGERYSRDEE